MPRPKAGESKGDFVRRFHSEMASEFPDSAQRHAVALKQWVGKGLMGNLRAGALEELEHTKDPLTAIKIALDHLKERPDYYDRLGDAGLMEVGKGGNVMKFDPEVMKDLKAGVNAIVRAVNKAAYPEGTVTHRADGDWKKVGGTWVKVPAQQRQNQGDGGKAPTKAPAGKTLNNDQLNQALGMPRGELSRQKAGTTVRGPVKPDGTRDTYKKAGNDSWEVVGPTPDKAEAKDVSRDKVAGDNVSAVERVVDEGWDEDEVRDALHQAAMDAGKDHLVDDDAGTFDVADVLGKAGIDVTPYFHAGNR